MSTTSDIQMNQQGGRNNYNDFSSDNTLIGSKLFNESSVMSSSLDLSEISNNKSSKKNNNIFNTNHLTMKGGHDTLSGNNSKDKTIQMIKQKLQELQSSTIGMSIQNVQSGGFSNLNSNHVGNKKLSSKILKEIGINSSSTSEFCD
jgi:hypothetical protein